MLEEQDLGLGFGGRLRCRAREAAPPRGRRRMLEEQDRRGLPVLPPLPEADPVDRAAGGAAGREAAPATAAAGDAPTVVSSRGVTG